MSALGVVAEDGDRCFSAKAFGRPSLVVDEAEDDDDEEDDDGEAVNGHICSVDVEWGTSRKGEPCFASKLYLTY